MPKTRTTTCEKKHKACIVWDEFVITARFLVFGVNHLRTAKAFPKYLLPYITAHVCGAVLSNLVSDLGELVE